MAERYIEDYTGRSWARDQIPAENDIYRWVRPDWGRLYADDGHLIYEGNLVGGMAFGSGTAYYPDGKVAQEGLFGPKGLICGRVYYDNGNIRFEGSFQYNSGYGPNWPIFGAWYDQEGSLKYYGPFKVIGRGGSVHMPEVLEPKGFGNVPRLGADSKFAFGGQEAEKYYKLRLCQKTKVQPGSAVPVHPPVLSCSQEGKNMDNSKTTNQRKEGIEFLLEYRAHPEKYLPLVDHQYHHFDQWEEQIIRNQCWGAGLLEGNRPYFMECWKVFLATSITVFISSEGIDRTEAVRMLERTGLVRCVDPGKAKPEILEFKDSNENGFYSINTVIGVDEEGQFLFWNGKTHPFDELNEMNERTGVNKYKD